MGLTERAISAITGGVRRHENHHSRCRSLGNHVGRHLARAGEDVTLIARGQRAAYLQEHGATITGLVDFTVPVRVVTDPSQVDNADVLIVTVKTYDMDAALASVKHLDAGSVLSI